MGTGVELSQASPHLRRDTVAPHVADLVSEMLVAVTEGEGTGVEAAIPGFRVAGKTATAQKIDPATGKYTDAHYVASFVGFVPVEKPRLVIAVVLDEPMGGTHAGGSVAAPVFRRVGEMALRYLGVFPKGSVPMKLSDVSKGVEKDLAVGAYQVIGEARQENKPANATMTLTSPMRAGEARVPDFSGYPAREAVKAAIALGLVPAVEGTGRLARQEPAAGAVIAKGATIKLVFEPPS